MLIITSQPEPPWKSCIADACSGVQLGPAEGLCLSHASTRKREAALRAISKGDIVSCFRGIAVDRQLLDTVLRVAPRNTEGRIVLAGADFTRASFREESDLSGITFSGACSFVGTEFEESVDLSDAVFLHRVDLSWMTCWAALRCRSTNFRGPVYAIRATFLGSVDFYQALMLREVNLYRAMFARVPSFAKAEFRGPLLAMHAESPAPPDFSETIFSTPPAWG